MKGKINERGIMLGISEYAVPKIIKIYEDSGSVEKRPKGGSRHTKLTEEITSRLIDLINDENLYTLADIQHHLGIEVYPSIVWKWLKKLIYSWKITSSIPERRNDDVVKSERVEYIRWYQSFNRHKRYTNIIYIDESPFNLHIIKTHA
ncbi:hypothetical protein RF11_07878 [Thelohanellus kitauei]|uniref:Winged helix-turn helix domain-containing protein n=1 Tax=Thelohanellus kitauei TaxID=669202 RepID=A0A0C2J285_THEKT|nr:hypothetical protein RF11_07878 [Thelohanellus kitauei]